MAADGIGEAVVADIYHNKKIASADGFLITSLGFPRSEAGAGTFDQIGILGVFLEMDVVPVLGVGFPAEVHQILIYFCCKVQATVQGRDFQACHR